VAVLSFALLLVMALDLFVSSLEGACLTRRRWMVLGKGLVLLLSA